MVIHNLAELLECNGYADFKDLQRRLYKYTDCGAWADCSDSGVRIGSIVEGTDAEVEPVQLEYPFQSTAWYEAIQSVESEAESIWNDTHGCGGCAWMNGDDGCDETPINPDCPACNGDGVIL